MWTYEQSVAEHQRLRPIRMALNSKLLQQVSRKALVKAGRKLGLLINGVLCFETEDESSVLADYCIHEHRELGRNAVDRLLSRPGLSADERSILDSMRRCWFSLFEIGRVVSGGGVLAARLIPFGEFFISTGAALPVDVETLECIVDELARYRSSYHPTDTPSPRQTAEITAVIGVPAWLMALRIISATHERVVSTSGLRSPVKASLRAV